jgi:anti-sigma regulatory factor (Ser/Thr protein kinase)
MNEFIQIERFRKNGLKLVPQANISEFQLPIELISLFEKYEKDGFRFFALDLKNMKKLSHELIVLMLEMTARLRRRGGDLTVMNLHYDILEDLLTFNPKDFLAVAQDEMSAEKSSRAEKSSSQTTVKGRPSVKPISKIVNRIEIPYNEDDVYKACDFVLAHAANMGFPETEASRIKIAVYEACLNAIQHSRKMNPGDKVSIEVETIDNKLQINVYDRGTGFDPEKTNDYDVTEAASHRKTGGMGLHIIRRAMDEVNYEVDQLNGNKLVMVKYMR